MKMIKIIKKEELLEMIENKKNFLLLDVRDTSEYKKEHVITAKHLPISQIESKIDTFANKEDTIITYSEDLNCPASGIAAKKISGLGFKNVLRYKGGWKEWKQAELPTEI